MLEVFFNKVVGLKHLRKAACENNNKQEDAIMPVIAICLLGYS